jgi:hypothetical protein
MASALLGFARDYWENDQKDDALETLDEAYAILKSQRDIETRDSRARNSLMASIAVQFAGFGKADRGTEIALENADHDDRMAALGQIAHVLTRDRQDDLARQTVNLIEEDANRLFALISLSEAKIKLGEQAAASKFLDEAAELIETVPQLAARSAVLNEIAVRYAEHGEKGRAKELALQNLELIAEIRDESSQASALASLSETFAMADIELSDSARHTIDKMIREADRPA